MRESLSLIRNRWKQYAKRVFLSDTNNNLVWYENLIKYLLNLNTVLEKKLKLEEPIIIIVSNDLLVKIVVFMYCFLTNTNFILISPKFSIVEVINAIAAKRANVLIIDMDIKHKISMYEQEEGINIFKYFKCVETTAKLLEVITGPAIGTSHINVLFRKGLRTIETLSLENKLIEIQKIFNSDFENREIPKVTILSPGSSTESSFINVPYKVLCKSMQLMSYFIGLKPEDKISIITDFEFFPNMFTLLGFLNGVQFVQPNVDINSAEEFTDEFKKFSIKPNVIIIDSYRFKTIWDSLVLKVYGNRLMFKLSKYKLLERISEYILLQEIQKLFGKGTKVHILNEELGLYCLGILKRSKVLFTSSYGYLEQGNFLAFKDPILFKNKKFYSKPGGTILKDSAELFDSVGVEDSVAVRFLDDEEDLVGEVTVKTIIAGKPWIMRSEDLGTEIPNISSQGNRKFLYIFGRICRYPLFIPLINNSLELMEKSVKDTLLIRDCLIIRDGDELSLVIEPRFDIFDIHRISEEELKAVIQSLIDSLRKDNNVVINKLVTMELNGMRNIIGKIQLYYNI